MTDILCATKQERGIGFIEKPGVETSSKLVMFNLGWEISL